MSTTQSNSKKFSLALRFFHWTGLLVMAVVYSSVWMRNLYEKGTDARALVMNLHKGLGFLILAWLVFRLISYYTGARPPILPPQPAWQATALKVMHGVLWGLMLVLPLSGWLMGNAYGRGVEIPFVGIKLPTLVEKNDTLAKMLGEGHKVMALVLLAFIAMHTLIGLWHHFLRKDNALKRML